jgi:LuxR family transcriptional regulator, quorum-sensing system regulator BjaR1
MMSLRHEGRPEMETTAFDFIEKITALDTPEAVIGAFRAEAGRFGYSTFALGALPRPGSPSLPPFFVSSWPKAWIDTYVGDGLMSHDPTISHGYHGVLPATWSELHQSYGDDRKHARTLDAAKASGWPNGLAIPVHGPRGYRGLVTVAGDTGDLTPRNRATLHLMALYLHERLKTLMAPGLAAPEGEIPRLTAGEIECIRWLIAGKSDWEIGEILHIAEATSHWRIERAKKKLGVKTRAQLTAVAIHYGLISL